jgi:hypothetical protein
MGRALLLVLASAAVYVSAVAWAASRLPEDGVALHVNTEGVVNAYGSRAVAMGLFVTVGSVLIVLAMVSVASARWLPPSLINVPHKEFWTQPSRLARFRRMLCWDLAVLFSLPLLVFSYLPVDITLTTSDPVGHRQFWFVLAIGLLLLGVAAYVGWMVLRRYRPINGGAER